MSRLQRIGYGVITIVGFMFLTLVFFKSFVYTTDGFFALMFLTYMGLGLLAVGYGVYLVVSACRAPRPGGLV